MPENKRKEIADSADMMVDGFAFQRFGDNIRIINLNTREANVLIISPDGKPLESDMDPIEQQIALDAWLSNEEFMEA